MGVDHLIVLSKLLFWIPFIIMTSAFFYLFKRPNKYLLLSACPMIYFIHKIRGFYYYDSGISLFCYEIGLLASAIFFGSIISSVGDAFCCQYFFFFLINANRHLEIL
ncbi:hypothetical protein [Enterococcus faecium]|uniref:hypothetical protein n=1 Tax=Enterococcus faecium TaxID=1352 RepID=UPI0030C6C439